MADTRTADLQREIAGISRLPGLIYGGNGLAQANDETLRLRGRSKGLDLYDDIERDAHAGAVLQKRKLAVVGREWTVDAASDAAADVEAAEVVEAALKAVSFDRLTLALLDAILKGYAVAEILWAPAGNLLLPARFKARAQKRFVFDLDGRPRLRTIEEPAKGIELPERKFIVHRFGAKDDNPYGLGLGSVLYWPTWFKRQGLSFWLTFVDKFAQPTAVGTYPPNAEKTDQDKLLAALAAITRDTSIIMPAGMEAKFLEATRASSTDAYDRLCRYMDEQISEATLGETLSTNIGGGGSFAAAGVHNEVRAELTDADCDLVSDTLNETLIRWIVELNRPNAAPPKVWRAKPEDEAAEEELKTKRTDRVGKIHGLGFRLADDEAYERLLGEKVIRQEVAAPPPPPADFAERAGRDSLDDMVAELTEGDGWRELIGPTVEDIVARMAAAKDADEAKAVLAACFSELDVSGLQKRMQDAIFTSWLAGDLGAPISDRS